MISQRYNGTRKTQNTKQRGSPPPASYGVLSVWNGVAVVMPVVMMVLMKLLLVEVDGERPRTRAGVVPNVVLSGRSAPAEILHGTQHSRKKEGRKNGIDRKRGQRSRTMFSGEK